MSILEVLSFIQQMKIHFGLQHMVHYGAVEATEAYTKLQMAGKHGVEPYIFLKIQVLQKFIWTLQIRIYYMPLRISEEEENGHLSVVVQNLDCTNRLMVERLGAKSIKDYPQDIWDA